MSKIVYVNEKIKEREMAYKYKHGQYGLENIECKFKMSPILNPHGDITLVAGYTAYPEYDNRYLMSAEEAMELGILLFNTAYDAMKYKKINMDKESYEARLSFLVLKGLIDRITVERTETELANYVEPFYEYTITAYRGDKEILSYCVAANLSYFTKESEIKYWIDCMTAKKEIEVEFIEWDPYEELKERQMEVQEKLNRELNEIGKVINPNTQL